MSLKGKHALITGSSRGIGRGIALKLAEHGVNVAVHYYQNETAALETFGQVRERDADGFVVQADVLDPKQITQMFGKVKAEFGNLDIFVSNARPEARMDSNGAAGNARRCGQCCAAILFGGSQLDHWASGIRR